MPNEAQLVSDTAQTRLMSTQFTLQKVVENVYIRLFHVEWYQLRPAVWKLRDMQNSFWRFYMNDSEGASLECAGSTIYLRAGQQYLIPAGVRFSTHTVDEINQFYVHFDVMGLPGFATRELFDSPIHLPSSQAQEQQAQNIAQHLQQSRSLDLALHLQIKAMLYDGLARYLQSLPEERMQQYQAVMAELAPVLPAIRHMEQHLTTPLSNHELAQRCHMSESHFIRRFHKCVQQTPKQYLLERRVQIAAQHLLFSDRSIDHIATETGFGNRFYFSRVFSRKTGTTPAAYRKTSRV
jgi:AraC-like DNA-binding protein